MTYQTTVAQQRNFNFFGFFSALYLVVSDILLTHTHTHTQAQLTSKPTFFVLSYARVRRAVTLVNKGLLGASFVCLFVFISRHFKSQSKERLTTQFTSIEIYKSLLTVLLLTSQEGTINLMPTCWEQAFRRIFIFSVLIQPFSDNNNDILKLHINNNYFIK